MVAAIRELRPGPLVGNETASTPPHGFRGGFLNLQIKSAASTQIGLELPSFIGLLDLMPPGQAGLNHQ
jgi:hypothetical protein